jgi:hypothetical protein
LANHHAYTVSANRRSANWQDPRKTSTVSDSLGINVMITYKNILAEKIGESEWTLVRQVLN